MTKYREILRLKSLGFSERNIAQSCGVSRNTVAKVLKKTAEIIPEAEARNLFELIHKKRKKSSTIFCSQFREIE